MLDHFFSTVDFDLGNYPNVALVIFINVNHLSIFVPTLKLSMNNQTCFWRPGKCGKLVVGEELEKVISYHQGRKLSNSVHTVYKQYLGIHQSFISQVL